MSRTRNFAKLVGQKRSILRCSLFLTIAFLMPLTLLHAQSTLTTGTPYNIVNENSGSCVDDTASGTANGTAVQQWACGEGTYSTQPNQQWEFENGTASGYYYVANVNAPAETWNVTGNGTTNGSLIQTWTYAGNSNEEWEAVSLGNGYYKFVGQGSGLCLDTPSASTANGVQLQIYTCNGTAAQAFKLVTPSSGTGTGTGTATNIFAPFEYVGDLGDANQIPGIVSASGAKAVILAFLDPDNNGCNLIWPGANGPLPDDTVGSTSMGTAIADLQAAGVTVALSQGGAGGQEAAAYCSTAAETQAVYQTLITKYHVNWLDFDVEYSETSGQSPRRAQALAALQAANPGLIVSYTLPLGPGGLDSGTGGGYTDITDAKAAGLNLTIVNGMAMDFGGTNENQPELSEEGAAALESQIQSAGLTSTVGLTFLPGTSDDTPPNYFTLANATTMLDWAEANKYVTLLSFWELNRDNGGCPGSTVDEDTCSGVSQSNYEFSSIFEPF
ncbi:RICIN domain-containing protein [Granulicella sp. S156]|uniref:RICIN domain-containing protein n=1 Tax=Granulicella sp. S156 TaxID=1747224 RepID=UPI00131E0C0A|nr:RICIN domain-containing protein [Granulicella sp. S156]